MVIFLLVLQFVCEFFKDYFAYQNKYMYITTHGYICQILSAFMTELKLLLRLLDLFMLNVTLKKSNGINRILGLALNTEKFMLLGSNTESARQGSRFRRSKPRNINFSVFNANLVFSISIRLCTLKYISILFGTKLVDRYCHQQVRLICATSYIRNVICY